MFEVLRISTIAKATCIAALFCSSAAAQSARPSPSPTPPMLYSENCTYTWSDQGRREWVCSVKQEETCGSIDLQGASLDDWVAGMLGSCQQEFSRTSGIIFKKTTDYTRRTESEGVIVDDGDVYYYHNDVVDPDDPRSDTEYSGLTEVSGEVEEISVDERCSYCDFFYNNNLENPPREMYDDMADLRAWCETEAWRSC